MGCRILAAQSFDVLWWVASPRTGGAGFLPRPAANVSPTFPSSRDCPPGDATVPVAVVPAPRAGSQCHTACKRSGPSGDYHTESGALQNGCFALRNDVIADYANYVKSFVRIRDPHVRAFVDDELASGALWPEPLVQLNPAYAPGRWRSMNSWARVSCIGSAVKSPRGKDSGGVGEPLRLYAHQRRAIEVAATGNSYVLTTGTGSGKSLAYMVPIIDHVLRKPTQDREGHISAIVVYPMNALCNSQVEELRKFLVAGNGGGPGTVTFARYTGQESAEERSALANAVPDILLTNFMMLELIMTRPKDVDRKVMQAAKGLDFLVLDELHTYRGRQGADVAMLVRRVRERTHATDLRCVGTSATIAGAGTRAERLPDRGSSRIHHLRGERRSGTRDR